MATTPRTDRPPAPAERIPPQDLDAEMALLGSMMMSRDAIGAVIPILARQNSRWLYLPAHQRLFEVLIDLYDDPTKAIDLIVVSDELRRRPPPHGAPNKDMLEFIGGYEYMVQLAESFAEWVNAEHYARIVRDKGMLRDLIRCAGQITEQAYVGTDEAREILDWAEQQVFSVTEQRVTGRALGIGELLSKLSRQLTPGSDRVCTGLATGFTHLDEYTSGFQPGDLIVIAGRPSMGKTALGLTMAQHMAVADRRPVVFFSMEMSADQVAHRLACSYSQIDSQKLRRHVVSEQDIRRLLDACADFQDAPLFVDDTPGMTALELRSKSRRLKQRFDIQVVFIDYLQLMHMPNAESRQVEISTISRNLKSLGRELGIPVIAMAQLNRLPEGRHDKRPLMSDLRESGAIEQDADVVLLIHREEYYRPEDESVQGVAEVIIAKQRNGPVGSVQLQFNKKLTRFADLHVGPEPAFVRETEVVPF
jgi:replicative DNA helicase